MDYGLFELVGIWGGWGFAGYCLGKFVAWLTDWEWR